ncbi:hypothetical protein EXIGLDRAFT_761822 [Exidia glandulosa HHB12029]|uniref:HNH nuclease domain-containing protein n=1 Tax=Exidia glandulosa HHB12029 TaxID=1314781 RepID=A0A165N4Q8_EXIGL|nr:hypothetical protein EXIGLDRAFT_761822 [Exidia glandulosa HHB12029]
MAHLCKMDSTILDDHFWANALLLQQNGDLYELDCQSSQLLHQFQADHRATPAWRLDDDVISGILYNVLQSIVDTTRGGTSDQERNAHKHVVSCICACASNGSGDPAMDRMAHLATTWIACVYWMLWDYGPYRKSPEPETTSRNAELVFKRVAVPSPENTVQLSIDLARTADDVLTIRCMQQLSGMSVDEFDQILGTLDQPSNAITTAALSADTTFWEHMWGLQETDIKDHYRIQNFWGGNVTLPGHPPLSHVKFRSRGVGVAPPDVRLLRFHAMVGQVIYGSGLGKLFFNATGDMDTCTTPATVTPQQFYNVAANGPSALPCRDPSSDDDDGDSDYVPNDEDEDEDEDIFESCELWR